MFSYLIFPASLVSQEMTKDQCLNCHEILEGRLKSPAVLFRSDIHFRKGYTCATCHGGDYKEEDQDKSMSRDAGFVGVQRGGDVTKMCAKCHKDEFTSLMKSVHGESSTGKGVIIGNCLTCHGIHNIVSVKSPSSRVNGANLVKTCSSCHSDASYMKKYNPGIRVDQLEKYKTSVHGQKVFAGDSKAANCASCHGGHEVKHVNDPSSKVYKSNIPTTCNSCHGDENYMKEYKIPTDQYEKYKASVHGIALFERGDNSAPTCNNCHGNHGAFPPEVESISKVCGICHVINSQLFQESPHKSAFDSKGQHGCGECHNNHLIEKSTDEMLGVGEKSVCIKCHINDKGYEAAKTMKFMIDSLMKEVDVANYFINDAEQKGMDVSDDKFDANDIKTVLITTRTITHQCNLDEYIASINEGFKLTQDAKIAGDNAVKEYYFRRLGLGVSTVFITILAVTLLLKLRKIEKKQSNNQIIK